MRPVAALTAALRSVGEAAFHGPIWVNARIVPGLVPPPTRHFQRKDAGQAIGSLRGMPRRDCHGHELVTKGAA
jgi:hypothetical protein